MGVKCKQADLVSVYTLFCIEINKDGQGRDWKKDLGLGCAMFPVLPEQPGEGRNASSSVVRLFWFKNL